MLKLTSGSSNEFLAYVFASDILIWIIVYYRCIAWWEQWANSGSSSVRNGV